MLVVLSGLPGVGKTTIARALARAIGAVHVRIDSIEQTLRQAGWEVEGEGYAVAWRSVAARAGVRAIEVELICSDAAEHRRRVETRTSDLEGHRVPTWAEVQSHDYRPWDRDRLIVDTTMWSSDQVVQRVRAVLEV